MPQPPNLQKMLAEAQAMLAQQQEAQEALKAEKVDASTGGGTVKIVMTGDLRVESLMIDPDAVDPEDVEMLQDLVVAAVNEAIRKAEELQQSQPRRRRAGRLRPDERPRVARPRRHGRHGRRRRTPGRHARRRRRAKPRRAARPERRSSCSPHPSSGSSPSSRSCRGSATAPPSGSRSTSCAPPTDDAYALAAAIREVKEKITLCEICFNLAEGPRCTICLDERRDPQRCSASSRSRRT